MDWAAVSSAEWCKIGGLKQFESRSEEWKKQVPRSHEFWRCIGQRKLGAFWVEVLRTSGMQMGMPRVGQ